MLGETRVKDPSPWRLINRQPSRGSISTHIFALHSLHTSYFVLLLTWASECNRRWSSHFVPRRLNQTSLEGDHEEPIQTPTDLEPTITKLKKIKREIKLFIDNLNKFKFHICVMDKWTGDFLLWYSLWFKRCYFS